METTLHRQLKGIYGTDCGGRSEVEEEGFRADAVGVDGEWIEVQSGPLGPLRAKLHRLLPDRRIRVVKPIVLERRIVRRALRNGADLSARLSPRRGALLDVFDDLVGLMSVFPHANLRLEVLAVAIDEVRIPRRRWPGYTVVDRSLRAIRGTTTLCVAADLWELLPDDLPDPFTTLDLSRRLDRHVAFAQRVAYCLRLSGAALASGKMGNRLVYTKAAGWTAHRRTEVSYERA
jgi:hypothetical protein